MGTFKEEITLENIVDRGLANRGYIDEGQIRTLTVQALPLEGMDLIVDPVHKRLAGAHGDQPLHVLYVLKG
jgi:hypothetical protein